VKEFRKSVNIWGSYGQEFSVLFFLRHSVVNDSHLCCITEGISDFGVSSMSAHRCKHTHQSRGVNKLKCTVAELVTNYIAIIKYFRDLIFRVYCLQCFYAVGWAAGRASSL